jgi:hypothetical protein
MIDIVVNSSFTDVIYIPESSLGDTVTYAIYKSDGTVFASGNLTFLVGHSWKVVFTPTAIGIYTLEWNNSTLDRGDQRTYRSLGAVASITPDSDYSFDISTNLGKVRALIGDTDATSVLLTDAKINAFLTIKSNDLLAAASLALYAISANKAMLAKKKSAGNYSEDLSAIAKECRETAKVYDDMAKNVPAEAVSEQFYTDFAYRDLVINKILRNEDD